MHLIYKVQRLTVLFVKYALTRGMSSGIFPILAENISMNDAKVKSDLLREGCRPPIISIKKTYIRKKLMKEQPEWF